MFQPISVISKRTFCKNKGRNLVAVTAIVLTTLMFTTLFVLSRSIDKNIVEMTFRQTGYDTQVSFKSITAEQADRIASHPEVAEVGNSLVAGLVEDTRVAGRQVEVRWADESYAAHSFALPVTGRMPRSMDEIALDTIVLDRLGVAHELGAQVTFQWMADFVSKELITSTFTLCGFWEGNESGYASMAWVGEEFAEAAVESAGRANPEEMIGLRMAQVSLYSDRDIEGTMERILSELRMDGLEYAVNLAYSPEMNRMAMQESLPMYVGMVLVFLAGYLIIYNIFQISVTADIQFYGKLKTLGATKRQLKKLIYGQAWRLCVIGIPLGLILGYVLGVVLVPVLISFRTGNASASPVIFIGATVFAVLTVLVSCMRPAKMAAKVSPMEALRYSDVEDGGRRRKKRQGSASLTALAWSNLGRNRKRTVIIICSLVLGLTLMSCFYAKNVSFDMEKYLAGLTVADYQIDEITNEAYMTGYEPQGDSLDEQLVGLVESIDGLEETGHLYSHETEIVLDGQTVENIREFYTGERLDAWAAYDPSGVESMKKALENKKASSVVYGIDGIPLDVYSEEAYWENGSFDEALFATGGYVLAIGPGMEPGIQKQSMPTVAVGDSVTIEGREYTVMAVLNNLQPVTEGATEGGPQDTFYLNFIMPAETFRECWPDNTLRKLYFNVEDGKIEEAQEKLDAYFGETGLTLPVTSRQSMARQYERETRAGAVMGNAISVVVALVGILNFANSMVTSIIARKKEFAMIQSVGMTKSQLCKLLVTEGLAYAGLTLIVTYALSTLAVGVGVRAMVEGGFSTFRFTLLPLVLCTPVLVGIAILVPYLCFRNIEKDSLVERLRWSD